MKIDSVDLEFQMIGILRGKMNLLQPQHEKESMAQEAMKSLLEKEEFKEFKSLFQSSGEKNKFIQDFLSFGVVTEVLCDDKVEDIIINNLKPIYIHHAQKGFIATDKAFKTQKEVDLFVQKLIVFSGREKHGKLINLELPNLEGRVNIAFSSFGPQVTITKAKVSPLSIIDLIRAGSLTHSVAAQLWIYIEGLSIRPANIMIAGGPGVGKTTLLNALFSFIPQSDRMVVIEDTLELNTFLEDSCSRLESDEDVTLADLVKNSLRMRPERVVIGEIRGIEAADMITACNIGKYCISTIHALTSREAIIRLQNEPMNIPQTLVNLLDVFIVLKRYHADGKVFRVIEEVSETSGMEQLKILLSHIYKYDYEKKAIDQISPSTYYRDRLAQESGIRPRDIIKEHIVRTFLLRQLDAKGLSTIKEVATFCRFYSENPQQAVRQLGYDRNQLLVEAEKAIK